ERPARAWSQAVRRSRGRRPAADRLAAERDDLRHLLRRPARPAPGAAVRGARGVAGVRDGVAVRPRYALDPELEGLLDRVPPNGPAGDSGPVPQLIREKEGGRTSARHVTVTVEIDPCVGTCPRCARTFGRRLSRIGWRSSSTIPRQRRDERSGI